MYLCLIWNRMVRLEIWTYNIILVVIPFPPNYCRTILRATVILLPLLGLTWVFGILTLDANATVFAWLFTIFNSLQVNTTSMHHAFPHSYYVEVYIICFYVPQGVGILFFNVIRSDKVIVHVLLNHLAMHQQKYK